jgi:hypothetical protein
VDIGGMGGRLCASQLRDGGASRSAVAKKARAANAKRVAPLPAVVSASP